MKIVGLSGGIASGKNFVAEIFAKNGAAIFDADRETHNLLESDKLSYEEIRKNFLQAIINEKIDRRILGKIVFDDKNKLEILEKILHPKIRKKYQDFLNTARSEGCKLVVLNIPLLLEKESYACDYIVAIITPKHIRKERFLKRSEELDRGNFAKNKSQLEERFEKIFVNQIDDEIRKSKANFVIDSSGTKEDVEEEVKKILSVMIL
jgi:dephospho-CoA kinase